MRTGLVLLVVGLTACSHDPNPYRNTPVAADLTDATALVKFGAASTFAVTPAEGQFVRQLEDGSFELVFPDHVIVVGFGANTTTGYANVTGNGREAYPEIEDVATEGFVWIPQEDGAPDDDGNLPGIWCNWLSFDLTADGVVAVRCLTPTEPSSDYLAGPNFDPFRALLTVDPGLAWATRLPPNGSGFEVWAVRNDVAVQATPLALESDTTLVPMTGGLAAFVEGHVELYTLAADDTVDLQVVPGSFIPAGLNGDYGYGSYNDVHTDDRGLFWGAKLLLEGGDGAPFLSIPDGGLQYPADVFTGPTQCWIHDEIISIGSESVRSDGHVAYTTFTDVDGANYCTCIEDGTCSVVDAAARAKLAVIFDGLNRGMRSADGTVIVQENGLYFLRDGIISDDFSSTIVVRDVFEMGGQLFFTGVNADNEGGMFRVDFDGAAFSFTQVETYGLAINTLVRLQ